MSSEGPLLLDQTSRGLLFVVSAPSGTGKTTVVEKLVQTCPRLVRSRSYTSRAPRPGERDGLDYNFVDRPAFEEMALRDGFLEWANVFGNLYGTGRQDTAKLLEAGLDVVLVIDVQGARFVRSRIRQAVGIFLLPPSFEVLETRLRGRCQDAEEVIERRLLTARSEVSAVTEYEYVVINDDFDRCVSEICAVVTAERARRGRRQQTIDEIAGTFGMPAARDQGDGE